jgi:hypothetical protein
MRAARGQSPPDQKYKRRNSDIAAWDHDHDLLEALALARMPATSGCLRSMRRQSSS